jgi:hypothetical protein
MRGLVAWAKISKNGHWAVIIFTTLGSRHILSDLPPDYLQQLSLPYYNSPPDVTGRHFGCDHERCRFLSNA